MCKLLITLRQIILAAIPWSYEETDGYKTYSIDPSNFQFHFAQVSFEALLHFFTQYETGTMTCLHIFKKMLQPLSQIRNMKNYKCSLPE